MPGSRRPPGCRRCAYRPHSERGRRTRPGSGIVPRGTPSGPPGRRIPGRGKQVAGPRAAGVRLHPRTRPAVASSRPPAARIVYRPEGARCSMMSAHRSNAGGNRQAGAAGPGWPDTRMEDGGARHARTRSGPIDCRLGMMCAWPCPGANRPIGHRHAAARRKAIYDADPHRGDCVPGIARTGTGQATQDAHSPYFVSGVCHAGGGFAEPCSGGRGGGVPTGGLARVAPVMRRSSGEPCPAGRRGPVHGVAAVPAYGAALQAPPAGAAAASPIP